MFRRKVWQENRTSQAKHEMARSFRSVVFGLQLIKYQKIVDYSAGNTLQAEITGTNPHGQGAQSINICSLPSNIMGTTLRNIQSKNGSTSA